MGIVFALAFLACAAAFTLFWLNALLHREPGVSIFSPRVMFAGAFTAEGRRFRRWAAYAWLAGIVVVLASLVIL